MVQRKSWRGKAFFSCSTYPECDVIVNDLSQLEEKYANHPRTAYVKKEKKGRRGAPVKESKAKEPKAKKAKAKETKEPKEKKARKPGVSVKLDPILAEVLGTNELPYTEITKKLWDYIRANNLQDTKNKRLIVPDGKLAKLFGSNEPLDMFKLAGVVKAHVIR
jgi:DNA topoisomerase-1